MFNMKQSFIPKKSSQRRRRWGYYHQRRHSGQTQVPGVVPRHVPGVVPIMFRGMSVLSTKPLKASPNRHQKRVIEVGVPPPKNEHMLAIYSPSFLHLNGGRLWPQIWIIWTKPKLIVAKPNKKYKARTHSCLKRSRAVSSQLCEEQPKHLSLCLCRWFFFQLFHRSWQNAFHAQMVNKFKNFAKLHLQFDWASLVTTSLQVFFWNWRRPQFCQFYLL